MSTYAVEPGSWAVIAGGSEGIGRGFAEALAAEGMNLVLVARKVAALDETVAAIRTLAPTIDVRAVSLDLARAGAADALIDACAGTAVSLFIYNAGAESRFDDFLSQDRLDVEARVLRNMLVPVNLIHHFGRAMRDRGGGAIVLMGSIAGYMGSPGFSLYAATKAFTQILAEGLWFELRKHSVHLLCAVIGTTRTPR